ncbi:hypothetical protein FXO38_11112 [Capsicum annuum]|nr:hypothetical protein FXO38_11112 [Capsicum annuum]
MKIKLFGATTILRKIILKGGLLVVDDGSGTGSSVAVRANVAPLTVFEITNHYDYDHTGYTDFVTSNECSACKCQDYKEKHDEVINAINALTASVKKMTSKRGVIPSKRISYPYTLVEVKVDLTVEATAKDYNITVNNPSTASKEEKVEPVSSREWKNYPFEGFNFSDKAPKKLTKLINNYLEWIADGLLKHHTSRYCQQQPKVSRNEECLIKTIKGFSIPADLPWHLIDEVYIPINCGDKFHWVLAVIILKERLIRVYDAISQWGHSGPSSEIQKLDKILSTYLDISCFLDQKVHTDWSMIEADRDKMRNPFDVEYIVGIDQQTISNL